MNTQHTSMQPGTSTTRRLRQRLTQHGELLLALLPTLTVLAMLWRLEALNNQWLLFASLASSAFLIYLDPKHGTNTVRTLVLSHVLAAMLGAIVVALLGAGYAAGSVAMIAIILLMVLLDIVHPPAVDTALSFAFRGEDERTILLFALALIAVLVVLQRGVLWLFKWLYTPR
jgi:CBS-domain-containing membrane protein